MAVTIYSTPTCGFCRLAKNYLKSNSVPFTEYNVATDATKAQEMVRKSGQMGVPVLDVNGKIIVGFDREAIDAALKR
ncbi:MAG: glutaredoxin domain-containing protein [Sphaerochaetaceae bacterium]|nr:glutathione S-transferase N-terminal domain-containing protein [Sphaerochaetaceae bacterium]NLO60866.1 NrdH-redoxin [Spirochaetales bacterium]MDD2407018.1 glutaredoxin domain-containing protein [Sphaerochaetaceae bacterium]MDD3669996.1 glutaredoxin domain-containing protein [Sphaerochaetaceae bacterium]MDD4259878.1 glutaredoxin domain-containing protein [Sphaerochaetaceae bacterium]